MNARPLLPPGLRVRIEGPTAGLFHDAEGRPAGVFVEFGPEGGRIAVAFRDGVFTGPDWTYVSLEGTTTGRDVGDAPVVRPDRLLLAVREPAVWE